MCGIVGLLQKNTQDLSTLISKLSDALMHRGPDDGGIWVDREHGLALGQRRLSILDLSELGHQPMFTSDGRFAIVYNGEVYNYREIAKRLEEEGLRFRSSCDTEVVLAAVATWGIEKALQHFNGMFAFAVLDRKERVLYLARDHLGIKPLYFGWNNGAFFFASELKPLHRHSDLRLEIDRSALALFMRHNYIPAPYTIYKHVYKLFPGSYLSLPLGAANSSHQGFSPWPEEKGAKLTPRRYWCPKSVNDKCRALGWGGSEEQATDELEALLKDSVRSQMISDVPLGVFLSGGVDSSTVAALAQAVCSQAVKTFSIGFEETAYDEAPFAKAVAAHLGTDHTELYISARDAMDVIPLLPRMFDEPFSDSSQVPTYLVSKLARSNVTVALSGDGGDELFCGYTRYTLAEAKWNKIKQVPWSVRARLGRILSSARLTEQSEDFQKYSQVLQQQRPENYYPWLMSHWKRPLRLVQGSCDAVTPLTNPELWPSEIGFMDSMMYLDAISYLPDDLLVKGDRASMAVSLEVRVPILDHRVVEFAWRLPVVMKSQNGINKRILRKVLHRYVPPSLIERPKRGFAVPIADWLRGPLREWAEDLLEPRRMQQEGYLDSRMVQKKWIEHSSAKRSWDGELWDVLMFQSWFRSGRE